MFEWLNDIGNYESRKVDKTVLENGLVVSTVFTSDEGYETAIISTTGNVYPVERYDEDADHQAEHDKWVEFAKDGIGKEITELGGLAGFVPDSQVILN